MNKWQRFHQLVLFLCLIIKCIWNCIKISQYNQPCICLKLIDWMSYYFFIFTLMLMIVSVNYLAYCCKNSELRLCRFPVTVSLDLVNKATFSSDWLIFLYSSRIKTSSFLRVAYTLFFTLITSSWFSLIPSRAVVRVCTFCLLISSKSFKIYLYFATRAFLIN